MNQAGSAFPVERRIFVVGVPRSGTTLVQSLLAAHSSLTSFTESHFFDRYFTLLPGLSQPILTRNPVPRLREFLAENEGEATGSLSWFGLGPAQSERNQGRLSLRFRPCLPFQTREVGRRLLEVFDELALERGQSGWLEKTPRHLRYLPFLEKLSNREAAASPRTVSPRTVSPRTVSPRTDFVHVMRGGVDVVASLFRASRQWERPYGLEECVRRWNEDVRYSISRIGAPNDHFVFYEDLTSDTETSLRQLLTDLDLSWEDEILESYSRDSQRWVTREETWKSSVGNKITPSKASHSTLTEEQRDWVSRALQHELLDELRNRLSTAS